jgi:glycosyltransferase involved in cell wall biosynthesis
MIQSPAEVNSFSKPLVVVTSDEPWSDVWHTQIHFAFQLSKIYNVIFLGPPSKWGFGTVFKSLAINKVSDSLIAIAYLNILPARLGRFAVWFNDLFNEYVISRMCKRFSWYDHFIVWHFDRYRSVHIWRSNQEVSHIYHVIDPVANLNYDRYLARFSDMVIVVSPRYLTHYQKLNKEVMLQGQGFDPTFSGVIPKDLSEYQPDSILLLGTLLDDVGFELLIEIAEKFKERKLVIIGPNRVADPNRLNLLNHLLTLKNVIWTGPLPPEKHLPYIWASSVCLVAYEITGKVQGKNHILSTPLKVLTYLACKKPVVSNINCEIPSLKDHGIFEEFDEKSFIDRVGWCLNQKNAIDIDLVDGFLNDNNYPKIISRVIDRLSAIESSPQK